MSSPSAPAAAATAGSRILNLHNSARATSAIARVGQCPPPRRAPARPWARTCRAPGRRASSPTTLVGQSLVNNLLAIGFLGLAAGSILYVVIELLAITRRTTLKIVSTWRVFLGLVLGFATDAIVTAAGA